MKLNILVLAAMLLLAGNAAAQNTFFTKDINTTPTNGSPSDFYTYGGTLYFTATNDFTGRELWKTDGTAAGTVLVKDINPGVGNSSISNYVGMDSYIYFPADDGVHGVELWRSDGTDTGTTLVKDIYPGSTGSSMGKPVSINGVLYFSAYDAIKGSELWKSDGTDSGTVMVKNINTGSASSWPSQLTVVNSELYFTATDSAHGAELWKSDGTDTGTVLVANLRPGTQSSSLSWLTEFKDTLFFLEYSSSFYRLYKAPGVTSSYDHIQSFSGGAGGLTVSGNKLFFSATDWNGNELWKTDGSSAGTVIVKDLDPGSYSSSPQSLTDVNGTLYFTADVDLGRELYKSDGTSSGTRLVSDMYTLQTDGFISNMTAVGNTLYFTAHRSPDYQDIELYKSTGSGATRVKDIISGDNGSYPHNLVAHSGNLYFAVHDSIHGDELWKSNGTDAGTALLKDVNDKTADAHISHLVAHKGKVYFNAFSPQYEEELWKSDGSASGTQLVKDISNSSSNPNSYTSDIGNLTAGGNDLFFSVVWPTASSSYDKLFKTNGTLAGTVDLGGGTANSVSLSYFTYWNNILFFIRKSSLVSYGHLYKYTSGSSSSLVKQINPNGLGDKISELEPLNGMLYFNADNGSTNGLELWKTDGTSGGTVLVKDIIPGSTGGNPYFFKALNNLLFFTATNGSDGAELWKSDGTDAGTMMVKDVNAGPNGSDIFLKIPGDGCIYFVANDGVHGKELWRSDGTDTGTVMVLDINPGVASGNPEWLTFASGKLFFEANDGINGKALWVSDGTGAGTHLVKDIVTGTGDPDIRDIIAKGDRVFFVANDGIHGSEVWVSNGTDAGTYLAGEVFAGSGSSAPTLLTLSGDSLYFVATHPQYGRELWGLDTRCMRADFSTVNGCALDAVQFTNTSDDYGKTITNYKWEFGTGDTASVASPAYTFANAGTYSVKLEISDSTGCSQSVTKNVTVYSNPSGVLSINGSTSVCIGTTANLRVNVTGGTAPYSLVYSDGVFNFTVNNYTSASNIPITPVSNQTYTLVSVNDAHGCNGGNASGSVAITVVPSPTSAVLSGTDDVCKNDTAYLQVAITGGTPPYTVVYNNGSNRTVSNYTSGSDIPVVPSATTNYQLVSVKDVNNCNAGSNSGTATLSVVTHNVNVSFARPVVTSLETNPAATYQWLDCNNGNTPISGATGKDYTVLVTGKYAVVVTINSCADTSNCLTFNAAPTGIEDNDGADLEMYPNPTTGAVLLTTKDGFYNAGLKILDVAGHLLIERKNLMGKDITADISEYPNGIYLVEIVQNGVVTRKRLLKY